MKQLTSEELKGKYVIAFDTFCTGMDCIKDNDEQPTLYDSYADAERDIDYPGEEFIELASEFIMGRKAIYIGNGLHIEGQPLLKQ